MRATVLAIVFLSLVSALAGETDTRTTHYIRFQQPKLLSFDDLVTLATVDPPPPELQTRLDALRTEPFLSNEATLNGVKPLQPATPGAGPTLRIAEWNINRLDKQFMLNAFSDFAAYQNTARANPKSTPKLLNLAFEQVRELQAADIVVLDEIDDGARRSGYHNVPRQIAQLLHMNYTFAVEFIELNSIYMAAHKMDLADQTRPLDETEKMGVDWKHDLGLEGTALLSRYPIVSARVVDLPQEYDWYHGQIGEISNLQKAENWSSQKLFDERMKRQVRRGGRIMLVVELAIPGVPSGVLTVLCPHLEDYTTPKGRRRQMGFILQQIGGISGPVLSAGDLNTLGHDGAPATVQRLLKKYIGNYKFWAREAFYFFVPAPGLSYVLFAVNYFKNFHDPTALNIPIFLPNRSEPLFRDLREFRFADGGRFDWAGRKNDSLHHRGRTLSDSNQRVWKGFHPTFSFRRTYHGTVGEFKIDWMLVKQPDPSASNRNALEALRPVRGRTLCELNSAVQDRISDHCPVTVDLPLQRR